MIKIITPGTRKTISCDTCGCVFSYEKEDEKLNAMKHERFVTCPQCNTRVPVGETPRIGNVEFPTFD